MNWFTIEQNRLSVAKIMGLEISPVLGGPKIPIEKINDHLDNVSSEGGLLGAIGHFLFVSKGDNALPVIIIKRQRFCGVRQSVALPLGRGFSM